MRVSKWGNSLAIRLPASVVEEMALKEGDELAVRASEEGRELRVTRKPNKEEILRSLDQFRGLIPSEDIKFDREEANAR